MQGFLQNRDMINALKFISPGTPLRQGIDNILKAKTGGLVVLASSKDINHIVDGGFKIDTEYSSAYIYELAKMDGAIVLNEDAKRILVANAQLIPDHTIQTSETGTRHRTAERIAKQTGSIVIAISQRRNIITIYRGNQKYVIQEISKILTKANQALQTLEKYKAVSDQAIINLNALEFNDLVTVYDVVIVLQKIEMAMRVIEIIERYIIELGYEGNLVSMQLEELLGNTKEEQKLILKDYKNKEIDIKEFKKKIKSLTSEELLELGTISKILGYSNNIDHIDVAIKSRGYRILSKIHRLPIVIIENLVSHFGSFEKILTATTQQLDEVEGIGEIRAKHIKNGLIKMNQLALLDRHI